MFLPLFLKNLVVVRQTLGVALFIVSVATGSPFNITDPDVQWYPPNWTGVIFPGGPEVTLNGTIPDVRQQILQINPNYDQDFGNKVTEANERRRKRNQADPEWPVLCNVPGGYSNLQYVDQFDLDLRWTDGSTTVGPGPKVCTPLVCTTGIAVSLCNDNPFTISPTTDYMTDYVYAIIGACANQDQQIVNGQQFDGDKYNVYIHAPTHCPNNN
ncbi:hypothetical protein MMC10_003640 [Thelotrema lepadinum]|nr:hypothetical protein [Thelotrema lepadinum]